MARSALEKVGLTGFENRDARALSGGESQRVVLARSLVLDPEVLLLDEPANHMDKAGVRRTEEIFLRLNEDHGKTVIFTTHDLLSGQRLAHRVINLFHGKLAPTSPENMFRGTPVDGGSVFRAGGLSISLPAPILQGSYVAIDPARIKLSRNTPDRAGRNTLEGRVVALTRENGGVRVEVEAGELIHVRLSADAPDVQAPALGDKVWLTLEDDAVSVLP